MQGGLAAADQLNKMGHRVTVLERSDRIGGKSWPPSGCLLGHHGTPGSLDSNTAFLLKHLVLTLDWLDPRELAAVALFDKPSPGVICIGSCVRIEFAEAL